MDDEAEQLEIEKELERIKREEDPYKNALGQVLPWEETNDDRTY